MQVTGQKRGKRVWQYTMRDIEEASGVPMRTLKEHRIRGRIEPDDLCSVAWYIAAHRAQAIAARYDDEVESI